MPEANFIFIVELVIVIAVIAILAAIMIPTFSGIVEKANSSALEQKIAAAYKEAMAEELANDKPADCINVNGIKFTWTDNAVSGKKEGDASVKFAAEKGYTGATITDGKVNLG